MEEGADVLQPLSFAAASRHAIESQVDWNTDLLS
jgi:hypothetical protein